jgi:hypothetical protein
MSLRPACLHSGYEANTGYVARLCIETKQNKTKTNQPLKVNLKKKFYWGTKKVLRARLVVYSCNLSHPEGRHRRIVSSRPARQRL